jgi:hypothetical protein
MRVDSHETLESVNGRIVDKRTEHLLAWYANGTLVGPDRDRVEETLSRDESAVQHLRWENALRSAIKADPDYDVADDRGLVQVMQRIRADGPVTAPVRTPPPRRPATNAAPGDSPSLLSRIREWINFSPGLTFACTVVAVQFVVIGQMMSAHNEEIAWAENRAVQNAGIRGDTFIRILFKPETTERQMSSMLRANNGEIVAGPTQLGEYYVLVTPRQAPQALARMLTNPNVDSAEIVSALPTKP